MNIANILTEYKIYKEITGTDKDTYYTQRIKSAVSIAEQFLWYRFLYKSDAVDVIYNKNFQYLSYYPVTDVVGEYKTLREDLGAVLCWEWEISYKGWYVTIADAPFGLLQCLFELVDSFEIGVWALNIKSESVNGTSITYSDQTLQQSILNQHLQLYRRMNV